MAQNASNVSYGKPKIEGAIWTAPLGSKLPINAIDNLDKAFKGLGYVSEDGLKNENSMESETIKAWGGDSVLVIQSEKTDTFTYKLIEILNVDVLKEVYGQTNVTGTLETGITIKANAKDLEEHVIVVDMILQGALKRIVIPKAKVSEISEVEYTDSDAVGYELTLTAIPDEKGNSHYEYIQKAPQVTGEQ
ncbi:phage tail protein [Lagierella sp. ICN-221743]